MILILLQLFNPALAQKPAITAAAYVNWPEVSAGNISNNGRYVSFRIKQSTGPMIADFTTIIRSVNDSWSIRIPGANFIMTQSAEFGFFKTKGDSLGMVRLGTSDINYIGDVASFKLSGSQNNECLAYLSQVVKKHLTIQKSSGKRIFEIDSCRDYQFVLGGKKLLVTMDTMINGSSGQALVIFDLKQFHRSIIWAGIGTISQFVFNEQRSLLAIGVLKDGDASIWIQRDPNKPAKLLIDSHVNGIFGDLKLGGIQEFSGDGQRLLFQLSEKSKPKAKENNIGLNLWSYFDSRLQSEQLFEDHGVRKFLASFDLKNGKIFRLQEINEEFFSSWPLARDAENEWYLLKHYLVEHGNRFEYNWNKSVKYSVWLVSERTGERHLLFNEKDDSNNLVKLSPDGQYLIWYDSPTGHYISKCLLTGVNADLTPNGWSVKSDEYMPNPSDIQNPIVGCTWDNQNVIFRDGYDLWKFALNGKTEPVCITSNYGKKHQISFDFIPVTTNVSRIGLEQRMLLSSFSYLTKDNGFFSVILNGSADPTEVTMGPYVYANTAIREIPMASRSPIQKAKDADVYLLERMSTEESPNIYVTKDFKKFDRMSDNFPERSFNWLSSELHNWKDADGTAYQGVLYKPENFDSTKKYPIIFNYYEKKSDELNVYHSPVGERGGIDIAYFVSNGYVVFTPDMIYNGKGAGAGALTTLVSSANYLSKMRFVDTGHLGINGHSFGGYETNFIVTHTNLFKAAVAGAGISNIISSYGDIWSTGSSVSEYYETRDGRIGASLIARPDLYIRNSPIFYADKVQTPLLMMNNRDDDAVHFNQGLEFFTVLRRSGKKVWMLQYDGANHTLYGEQAVDYEIRTRQFFDYYLKGKPAPNWMVRGIPASQKGIEDGLSLAPSGVEPPENLLTPEEQKKVDSLQHRKPITITIP